MEDGPPPPPPPHGEKPKRAGGLPDGNYDIFIIPPHSAGSGFVYLPSLQCHRNSFLAGVASTLVAVTVWSICVPVFKEWTRTIFASGGMSVVVLVLGVGVGGWAWGKSQSEGGQGFGTGMPPRGNPFNASGSAFPGTAPGAGAGAGGANANAYAGAGANPPPPQPPPPPPHQPEPAAPPPPPPPPNHSANTQSQDPPKTEETADAPPKSSWQRAKPAPTPNTPPKASSASSANWEKAREETRRKEELRKKMDEIKRKREEEEKEKQKQRDKEARERDFRERKEKREREAKEREAREAKEKLEKEAQAKAEAARKAAAATPPRTPSPQKKPPHPTARTEISEDDAYSFRPYDRPRPSYKSTASSIYSESSYTASDYTAKTSPPPHRGPYTTTDARKIVIRGAYSFNNAFMRTPIAKMVAGKPPITDGLILRITTEGMFIDDDIRGVAQREWDMKAWTIKTVETGELGNIQVVRGSLRDQEGKNTIFIIDASEKWKVAQGIESLKRGSVIRSCHYGTIAQSEVKTILENLGYLMK